MRLSRTLAGATIALLAVIALAAAPRGQAAKAAAGAEQAVLKADNARFDAMVIIPCSMGTLGRIASGASETTLLRAADVFLKERRKLILVPRETPWNLIHARNVVTLLEAGAIVLPAIPSFYSRPDSVTAVVDTVVWRILDQIGLPNPSAYRWGEAAKPSRKR